MASSKGGFNSVASICHGRDTWRIRVRVLRIWEMCPIADPENPFAVQLVLMDAEEVGVNVKRLRSALGNEFLPKPTVVTVMGHDLAATDV